jgi:outer membrane receptor for ferrienterochelin and colicins
MRERLRAPRRPGAGDRVRYGGPAAVAGCLLLVVALESTVVPTAPAATMADDYTNLSLEQLMAIPVYSAAKREQSTSEAPSSVTVVTSQDVRAFGWRTLSDLLRSVPGISILYTRTYGSMCVRGFERSDFGARILLLINGHRMNDPLYDSAAIMEDFILDLDLIDRVEIVRGPGSTLYGTNAFFAVVNVITKRADQFAGFEANVEAGSQASRRGRLTFGKVAADGAETILSASGFSSNGNTAIYMPSYDEGPGGFDGILRNGDAESTTRYMGSHRRGGLAVDGYFVGRGKDTPPAYWTVPWLPRHTYDARAFVEGRYEFALAENATLAARLYYDWYKYVGTYLYDVVGLPEFGVNVDESVSESVGGELQANWQPWTGHTATAGFEFRDNYRQMMKNYDTRPFASILDIDPETQILGLYLQDEFRPSSRLGITAGVRYDHYDSFGESVNPRLAIVAALDPATTIKLLSGKAFRAPNANEFYYEEFSDEYAVVRNPDLQPEKISTYEIVGERQFGPKWRGSIAGFYNQATDLINQQSVVEYDEDSNPVFTTYYSDNMDKVDARGVELHADGQVSSKTRVAVSYTRTKTKDAATGQQLSFTPKHMAKLSLTFPVLADAVSGGLEVQYTSDRFNSRGRGYDAHVLVNATLASARWKDRWEASLSAYNLFQAHYDNPAIGGLEALQDGRLLRLKLGMRF